MATSWSTDRPVSAATSSAPTLASVARFVLEPLASLKLTVALLALSIVLVFVGTLAQYDLDMWAVIDKYFRSWVTMVPLQVFFPVTFTGSEWNVPGAFPFPGGALLGTLMGINLLAAHGIRFKVQSRGMRTLAGLGVMAVGGLATYFVILSGNAGDEIQDSALLPWATVWLLFQLGLIAGWVGLVVLLVRLSPEKNIERWMLSSLVALLGLVIGWLLYQGDAARFDDSSMRILWQLAKATLAGGVLLAGCMLLFNKRAGVVLIHGGIGLMMLSEVVVYFLAVESQMTISEGQTASYTQDTRTVELAVIDRSQPDVDQVTVVPKSFLTAGRKIVHDQLPFTIVVDRFIPNTIVRRQASGETPDPALVIRDSKETWVIETVRPGAGADSDAKVDMSAAVVKCLDKQTGAELATIGVSTWHTFSEVPTPVQVGDQSYDVFLRFQRLYKPYEITLLDVRKDDYLGTDTPRNYSSDVRLVEPVKGIDRKVRIWMNNPLRFAGETFYQSGYHKDPSGSESTTLQVVTNAGWMIPYVACMIVAIGMLAHFGITLLRFLNRRTNEAERVVEAAKSVKKGRSTELNRDGASGGMWSAIFASVIVLLAVSMVAGRMKTPGVKEGDFDLANFGRLPVVFEGRSKPMDSMARNALRVISGKETFIDQNQVRQPAIRWFLDLIAGIDEGADHQIVRIESLDLQSLFKVEPREGFRYSLNELRARAKEFETALAEAEQRKAQERGLFDRKLIELDRRLKRLLLLHASFQPVRLPELPTVEQIQSDPDGARQKFMQLKFAYMQQKEMLLKMSPPLAVPVAHEKTWVLDAVETDWQPFALAWGQAFIDRQLFPEHGKVNPATKHLIGIFDAYRQGEVRNFNERVADYHDYLARANPPGMNAPQVQFEAWFNQSQPFLQAEICYLVALVLALAGWLVWPQGFNRAAFALLLFALVVHTSALAGRIYISGRPPVTNLYSSAVFIGWGCVVAGLVLEGIYRLGLGNIVAAISGFSTLVIADQLAADGDTFTVLQAVLDTQFWLTTHVVCITLGYTATFVAGLLGAVYVIHGLTPRSLTPELSKDMGRMIYGTLCFAIFLSFVGTVLGGLWADDSWGRFWGWDPKENGALIIVLWNAIALHAKWDGMVKERGLALLAIGGNIVTAWSWFGVNELGLGLHSYGFTEGRLFWMALFDLSQIGLIGAGLLFMRAPRPGAGASIA